MRILHYIDSLSARVGGPSRFVLDATRVLAKFGVRSTILTHEPPDADSFDPADPASPQIIHIKSDSPVDLWFGSHMKRTTKREIQRASVLHLHNLWGPRDLQIAANARTIGTPYVLSVHGMLDEWSLQQRTLKKMTYISLAAQNMIDGAARIHCTAAGELQQAARFFVASNADIVPPIVDLAPYRALPGPDLARARFESLRSGRPVVLCLSRVHYKKRPESLIATAASLRSRGLDTTVIIAGMGDEDYIQALKAQARSMNVDDLVTFTGSVTGQDKLSLYQAADLFVLPTSQENFGLVLIEAMACGTPVLTTKGTDIWPDIEASGGGHVADPESTEFVELIQSMFTIPEKRARMGQRARDWVLRTFNESQISARFVAMYRNALDANTNRPRTPMSTNGTSGMTG
ncbi:MAG: glycosyltransferase [Phycisphaerales bacterium]|nr:MAG: glycosyltransferase [Phycisphaerales bacterium]